MQESCNCLKVYIEQLIKELESDQYSIKKFDINDANYNFRMEKRGFDYSGFINFFFSYEEEIYSAKNNYKNSVNSRIEEIENKINNKLNEIKEKGIDNINLIFKTATSDFKNLEKNKIKIKEISKEIDDLIKLYYF